MVGAGLALALVWSPAEAQQGTWELGIDGGFVVTSPDIDGADSLFDVSLPFQFLRVGTFVSDQLSIEPTLAFNRMDFGGDDSMTTLSLLATGLYHFGADRTQRQFYLQAGAGLDYIGFSDEDGITQWLAGVGGGVKLPVMDHLALRLGALYLRSFENDDMWAANRFRGQVGVSVFTH